jgi:hypothetical protein
MTWKPTDDTGGVLDERGVSDVVAFVFVFSIIITSVGIVSAVGFTALEDLRASEQAVNAERGFESLGYNLGNVQRGHAPGRSGELKLNGGRIRTVDGSEVSVSIDGSAVTGSPFEMNTLQYDMQSRETSVAYESGAVFRSDRGGTVDVVGAKFTCREDEDYAIVSIVTIEGVGKTLGGDGTVQIIGREQSSKLVAYETGVGTVDVAVSNSEFEQGWDLFFESSRNDWDGSFGGSGEAQCDLGGSGTVLVRHTVIDIQFVS